MRNLGRRKLLVNRCIVWLLYEALLSEAWDLEGSSKGRSRRTPWKGRDTVSAVTVLLDGEEGIFFRVTKLGQIKGSEWRGREESGAVLESISSKNRVYKEGRESAVAGSL